MDRNIYMTKKSYILYSTPQYDSNWGNAGLPFSKHKVYKYMSIIINKMIPSDPLWLLDDFFSNGDFHG